MRRLLFFFTFCFVVTNHAAAEGLPTLVASHPHGVYNEAFTLTLSDSIANADVYYTTDGSVPDTTSQRYVSPLTIDCTTVLRAIVVSDDMTSRVFTSSYIFPEYVLVQTDTPAGYPNTWGSYASQSGEAKADYGMDPEVTGIPGMSQRIVDSFYELPIVSLATDRDNFFGLNADSEQGGIYIYTGAPVGDGIGRGWERPVSWELFGGEQNYNLQSDCGIRMHGGHGRLPEKNPKHSLRLVWRSCYGEDVFYAPLFGDDAPNKYRSLVLRAPFGNAWQHWNHKDREHAQYNRDFWARTVQKRMGHVAVEGFWVHLFINGIYWGIYNVCERIDDEFCVNHFGGKKDEWDVIKVDEHPSGGVLVAAEGNLERWNELVLLVKEAATSNNAYYRLQGLDNNGVRDTTLVPLLDVDNFIDYMIINGYAGNTDWDHHNWYAVYNHVQPERGFRFLCWDSEYILGDVNENVLMPSRKHKGILTELFHHLMSNPLFLHHFQERVGLYCTADGLLTPDSAAALWNEISKPLAQALCAESARWGDYRRDVHPWHGHGALYTADNQYAAERNRLLTSYFPQRTSIYLNQLRKRGWYPE